jgi:hypothetical protein
MKDREVIIKLLRRVAARMRVARVLREAGFALCVVLFALAAFELIRTSLADAINGFYQSVLVAALVAFCVFVILRALKRVSMAQAASLIDARLPLHDELKSAYWFVSQQQQADEGGAAFVQMHVANAARTAQQVRGARVLPFRVPRSLILAIVPAVVLAAAMWSGPNLVRAGTAPSAVEQSDSDLQNARALLAATASDAEEIKQLDRALAMFEEDDVSPQQLQMAVDQAREAMDQVNMRAAVAREGLAKLARAMRANPEFEPIAQALEEGRTGDAIAMLEQIRLENQAGAAGAAQAERAEAAQTTRSETELEQSIGQSARELASMTGTINDEALARLIDNLDDMDTNMQMQQRVNETRARSSNMSDMMRMNSQRSSLTASRFDDREQRPTAEPSPDSGKSDMRGGTMFRQGAMSRGDEPEADDGSTTGASTGHSAALALEGRATRRLEAQLKRETVRVGSDEEGSEKSDDSSWFYSASQQEKSQAALADVRARDDYNRADVMQPSRIPIQQQQAVRDYFINIHEGNNK